MPLSDFKLTANCTFSFDRTVSGWADITQGKNQIKFGDDIDPAVWTQAYASVLTIGSGANTTVDLSSFTSLALESVTFTHVLGIIVTVTGATGILKITPGASNGLVWFAGATDGLIVKAGENFTQIGDPAGTGITIDGTHKTLKFANTGAATITVTVAILGTTL